MHYGCVGIIVSDEEPSELYAEQYFYKYLFENDDYSEFVIHTPKNEIQNAAKKIATHSTDKEVKEMYKRKEYTQIVIDYEGGELDADGNIGYMENPYGEFDWFLIGGRWKGEIELSKYPKEKLNEYYEKIINVNDKEREKELFTKIVAPNVFPESIDLESNIVQRKNISDKTFRTLLERMYAFITEDYYEEICKKNIDRLIEEVDDDDWVCIIDGHN